MILKTAANMQEHGYIETGKEGGYYEVGGQRTEIGGGGGDSRFSTAEVEVSFTLNGNPLTIESYSVDMTTKFAAGAIVEPDPKHAYYSAKAIMDSSSNTMTPLLFNGEAYMHAIHARAGETFYVPNPEVAPVYTGDISTGTFLEEQVVLVRGNGTVTIEMMVED